MFKSAPFSGILRALSSCAVVFVAVGAGIVATSYLGAAMKYTPSLFFCAVVFSSWFGGFWAGTLASFLSVIALDYYFIPPLHALGVASEQTTDIIAFFSSAIFISWLSSEQSRTKTSVAKACDTLGSPASTSEKEERENSYQPETPSSEILVPQDANENREVSATTLGALDANTVHDLCHTIGADSKNDKCHYQRINTADTFVGPIRCPEKESAFLNEGDCWTIQYRGDVARLKATRGLRCLATLLSNPGREFHVSELFADVTEGQPTVEGASNNGNAAGFVYLDDGSPILDARAKAEYKGRLVQLRQELEDAERLNDTGRMVSVQQEMDCIADHLTAAFGLGGRDRKASSQAERARSAVTKRVKDSIQKISQTLPSLSHHFAESVKTGYFCSYSPSPERLVSWKVQISAQNARDSCVKRPGSLR
jgi:hypothetical protein